MDGGFVKLRMEISLGSNMFLVEAANVLDVVKII